MTIPRAVAATMALVLAYGLFAATEQPQDAPCGVLGAPPVLTGTRVATRIGATVRRFETEVPTSRVDAVTLSMWRTVFMFGTVFRSSAAGQDPPPAVATLEADQAQTQATHDTRCAPTMAAADGMVIGTWNLLFTNRDRNVVSGLGSLMDRTQVIGVQEFRSARNPQRRAKVEALAKARGWRIVSADLATPIMFDARVWSLVSQGRERVVVGGPVEGGRVGDEWLTWAVLRNGDGGSVVVTNWHLLSGVDNRGRLNTNRPRRVAKFTGQIRRIGVRLAALQASGVPVVGSCDCNVDVSADVRTGQSQNPVAVMGGIGFRSNAQLLGAVPTHTRRTIDLIWGSTGLLPVAQSVGCTCGSDHRQMVVGFGTPDGTSS